MLWTKIKIKYLGDMCQWVKTDVTSLKSLIKVLWSTVYLEHWFDHSSLFLSWDSYLWFWNLHTCIHYYFFVCHAGGPNTVCFVCFALRFLESIPQIPQTNKYFQWTLSILFLSCYSKRVWNNFSVIFLCLKVETLNKLCFFFVQAWWRRRSRKSKHLRRMRSSPAVLWRDQSNHLSPRPSFNRLRPDKVTTLWGRTTFYLIYLIIHLLSY